MVTQLVPEVLAWLVPRELDLGVAVSYAIVALALMIGGASALSWRGASRSDRRFATAVMVSAPVWPVAFVLLLLALIGYGLIAAVDVLLRLVAGVYRMMVAPFSRRGRRRRHRSRTAPPVLISSLERLEQKVPPRPMHTA